MNAHTHTHTHAHTRAHIRTRRSLVLSVALSLRSFLAVRFRYALSRNNYGSFARGLVRLPKNFAFYNTARPGRWFPVDGTDRERRRDANINFRMKTTTLVIARKEMIAL